MRVNERVKKIFSILLCLCMVLQNCPVVAFAATTDNLCDHHTEHTAECGYREGSAGSACTHEHSEDCYEILECLHECGTECEQGCAHECTVESGCITMELDCHHVHGDCGYSEGTAEVPCGHVHNGSCGYAQAVAGNPCANAETDPECDHSGDCGFVAAVEGQPCGHTACDDTCGYAPATEGTPCTHVCEVKVDSADSCYKLLCSHKDGGHDDACGYAQAVEAHECHYECAECEAEETPAPAPVCDCGTEDAAIHAVSCAVYVAPENPQCFCTEKCTEANIWCDVCGFDYTACTGTDRAVGYSGYELEGGSLSLGSIIVSTSGEDAGIKYRILSEPGNGESGTVCVYGHNGVSGEITIPGILDIRTNSGDNYSFIVTAIEANAFQGCSDLTSVMVQQGTDKVSIWESIIKTIGDGAFKGTQVQCATHRFTASAACDVCDHVCSHAPSENAVYTVIDDVTHSYKCTICSHIVTEEHTIIPETGKCICGANVAVAYVDNGPEKIYFDTVEKALAVCKASDDSRLMLFKAVDELVLDFVSAIHRVTLRVGSNAPIGKITVKGDVALTILDDTEVSGIHLENGQLVLEFITQENFHKCTVTASGTGTNLNVHVPSGYIICDKAGNVFTISNNTEKIEALVHSDKFSIDNHDWTGVQTSHVLSCPIEGCGVTVRRNYSYDLEYQNCQVCGARRPYAITVNPTENGTVTADKSYADESEVITLTVDPDDGYVTKSLEVFYQKNDGAEEASIADHTITPTPVADQPGKYIFEMPSANVYINAAFAVCDHSESEHTTATRDDEGKHSFTCTLCGGTGTEDHTYENGSCICDYEMAEASVTIGETTSYFQTLDEAVTEASKGTEASPATLTLRKDIDLGTASQTISSGVFTLDLNGCKLSSGNGNFGTLHLTGGNVTITDSSEAGTGTIRGTGDCGYGVYAANYATVTITGGTVSGDIYGVYALDNSTVEISGGEVSGDVDGVYGYSSTVTISGGTVSGDSDGVYALDNSTVEISGGTVSSNYDGVCADSSTVMISGGTVSGNYDGVYADSSTVTITGGTVSGKDRGVFGDSSTVTISGGEVSGDNYGVCVVSTTVTISGGSISGEVADICPYDAADTVNLTLAADKTEGATFPGGITVEETTLQAILGEGLAYWQDNKMVAVTDDQIRITDGDVTIRAACTHSGNTSQPADAGDGKHSFTCTVCGTTVTENHTMDRTTGKCACGVDMAVASTTVSGTTTYYETLKDAVAAAAVGTKDAPATVTVLKNIDIAETIQVSSGVFTLNLNGKTLRDYECDGLPDGIFFLHSDSTAHMTIADTEGGKLLADWGAIEIEAGSVTITGGNLSYAGVTSLGNSVSAYGGTLNISGGTVLGVDASGGTVNISGGSIESIHLFEHITANISGGSIRNLWVESAESNVKLSGGAFEHIHCWEKKVSELLADGYSYWNQEGTIMLNPEYDTDLDDVIVKATCLHPEEKLTYVTGDSSTHTWKCSDCNNNITEAHTEPPTYRLTADGEQHVATYACCGGTVTEDHKLSYWTEDNSIIWGCDCGFELIFTLEIPTGVVYGDSPLEVPHYTSNDTSYMGTLPEITVGGEDYKSFTPNAGTYEVVMAWGGKTVTGEYTIAPKELTKEDVTITLSPDSFLYDGLEKLPTVTIKLGDKTLVGGTYADGYTGSNTTCDYRLVIPYERVKPGRWAITVFFMNNYSGDAAVYYTITIPEAILSPAAPNGENGWYNSVSLLAPDGYAISTIQDGTFGASLDLEDGTSESFTYWLTYEENQDCEPVSLTWTGNIKIDGSAPTVSGAAASVTDSTASITVSAKDENSGVASTALRCSDSSVTIGALTDGAFPVSGMQPNTAYTFTLTVKDKAGNETVTTVNLITEKGSSSVTTAPTANKLTYTGKAQDLISGGEAEGGTMHYSTDNQTWSTTIPQGTTAGKYTVYYKVVGDANHTDTDVDSVEVTIAKAQAVITVDTTMITVTYGENVKLPTATTNFGTVVCDKTADDLVNAGTYTVTYTVAGAENFEGATKALTVKVEQLAVAEPTVTGTYTYSGREHTAQLTGVESYMTVASGNKGVGAGNYEVEVTLDGNHKWAEGSDGKVQWSIAKAEPKAEDFVFQAPGNLTYNGETKSASVSVKTGIDGMGEIIAVMYYNADSNIAVEKQPISAGNYFVQINVAAGENYTEKSFFRGEDWVFSIGKANAEITVNTTPITVTYGEPVTLPVATANFGTVTCDKTAADLENAGTYTVTYTVAGTANYDGDVKTVTVTVKRKTITEADVELVGTLTYTGKEQTQEITVTEGIAYTVTGNKATEVGDYDLTVTASGNYTGEVKLNWSIAKAPVTITGKDATVTYAGEDIDLRELFSIDENAGAADYTILDLTGDGSFNAAPYLYKVTKAGTFTVQVKTAATDNYTAGEATATLTVKKGKPTITVSIDGWTYGEEPNAPSSNGPGAVTYTYDDANGAYGGMEPPTDAGSWMVLATYTGDDLYDNGYGFAWFTIEKAALTIKAGDHAITYGEAPAANGVTGNGFVSIENFDNLSGVLTYTYTYEKFGNVGTYKITPAGLTSNNYDITFVDGTLTVTAKAITVTAEAKSKTYGEADPALTYKVEGLVNGDELTGELKRVAGENVGSYAIEQNTLTAGNNYRLTYTGAELTINAKAITEADVELNGSLTYTGEEQTQPITVTEGITYEVTGNKATNAGDYELTVKGTGNYTGEMKLPWKIAKASQTVTLDVSDLALSCSVTAERTAQAKTSLTYISSDPAVVAVDANGNLKALKPGTVTITVTAEETANYLGAKASFKVIVAHKYSAKVTAPTCEDKGYTTYTCACGDTYVADYVDALDHSWKSQVTKPATCTETGVRTYTCENDASHTYTEVIPVLDHTPKAAVEENRVEADCENEGSYELVTYCEVCGAELSRTSHTIPTTSHSFGQWTTIKQAACTEKGQERRDCDVCDHYETRFVAFTGHSYRDPMDPSCEVCGERRAVHVETIAMLRLYNPYSGEHFYTGSTEERDNLVAAGWNYEGVAWNAPVVYGEPVYRYYNPSAGDHHYTMSRAEGQNLIDAGWRYEGVAWNSASAEHLPIYRLYNPYMDIGAHHFTGSEEERDNLVAEGWIYEGIGWYALLY